MAGKNMDASKKTAVSGSKVSISYTIRMEDGTRVDGERVKRPLSFVIGSGTIFPKLEEGIIGMREQESKSIALTAAEAYGPYHQDRVLRMERQAFPESMTLLPGRAVQYQDTSGQRVNFIVNAVDADSVTVDGNHPLAGLDLVYEVTLLTLS